MIVECFLDDSKDQNQEFSYTCAGFYGNKTAWVSFENEWKEQLRKEGIAYFKTSEYKSLSGEFAKFRILNLPYGRQAATLVKDRLMQVALSHQKLRGVGVSIPVPVYRELQSLPYASNFYTGQIYRRAFESVLFKTLGNLIPHHTLGFAHDDGPDFDELRGIYQEFKKYNPNVGKRMGPFIPLDDKVFGSLQIADMLANSVMGRHTDQMKGLEVNPLDVDFLEMSQIFTWNVEYGLAVLKVNLEETGQPIPKELEHVNV